MKQAKVSRRTNDMMYIASVKDRQTKEITIIKMDYPSKKAFREELGYNGYMVRFIATEETFDEECAKYYERVQKQIRINKLMWESDTKLAQKMGMSTTQYRKWVKEI